MSSTNDTGTTLITRTSNNVDKNIADVTLGMQANVYFTHKSLIFRLFSIQRNHDFSSHIFTN